jgi:hypothetical protein
VCEVARLDWRKERCCACDKRFGKGSRANIAPRRLFGDTSGTTYEGAIERAGFDFVRANFGKSHCHLSFLRCLGYIQSHSPINTLLPTRLSQSMEPINRLVRIQHRSHACKAPPITPCLQVLKQESERNIPSLTMIVNKNSSQMTMCLRMLCSTRLVLYNAG